MLEDEAIRSFVQLVDGTRNVDQLIADFKPVVSQMPGQNGSVTREIVVGHLETAAKLALLVG